MTKVASSNFNGPVGSVVFSCWKSIKFIVAHPHTAPYDNNSKLPTNVWTNNHAN